MRRGGVRLQVSQSIFRSVGWLAGWLVGRLFGWLLCEKEKVVLSDNVNKSLGATNRSGVRRTW